MITVNQSFDLFINQGARECVVLAVIGDRALGEYVMPAGSTSLVYLKEDTSGAIQMCGNVSYAACPKKWIQAMKDAGTEWIGKGQGRRVSWKDALASLDEKVPSRYAIGQRWRVKDWDQHREREPFWFVIIGPGSKADRKLCRLEVPADRRSKFGGFSHHGLQQEYTHKHLRKSATLEETP